MSHGQLESHYSNFFSLSFRFFFCERNWENTIPQMQQFLKRRILKQIVHLTILITQFRYLLPVAEGESKPLLGPDQGYVDCFRSLISFLFFFSFIVPVFLFIAL